MRSSTLLSDRSRVNTIDPSRKPPPRISNRPQQRFSRRVLHNPALPRASAPACRHRRICTHPSACLQLRRRDCGLFGGGSPSPITARVTSTTTPHNNAIGATCTRLPPTRDCSFLFRRAPRSPSFTTTTTRSAVNDTWYFLRTTTTTPEDHHHGVGSGFPEYGWPGPDSRQSQP